jgi:hypothetical protein
MQPPFLDGEASSMPPGKRSISNENLRRPLTAAVARCSPGNAATHCTLAKRLRQKFMFLEKRIVVPADFFDP